MWQLPRKCVAKWMLDHPPRDRGAFLPGAAGPEQGLLASLFALLGWGKRNSLPPSPFSSGEQKSSEKTKLVPVRGREWPGFPGLTAAQSAQANLPAGPWP